MRVPNRKRKMTPLARFFIEPRQNLLRQIRTPKPVVLAGQGQLPVEAEQDDEEQQRKAQRAPDAVSKQLPILNSMPKTGMPERG